MTFLDLFAGIGGFRRGLELAGHQCIGFCEFDKFAAASYTSMHLITEEQREKLAGIPLKQRQTEILKEEYRNGEWYAADIRDIRAADMPKADCWCFGFPCQDISVAGKQAGFGGKRSSLFFTVTGLIRDLEKEDRPSCLLIENVKNLLSVNRGFDFARLLIELDEIGYDAQWQVINSACYVPQNRGRVFLVGSIRGRSTAEIFPVERADGEDRIYQIGNFMETKTRENPNQGRIYDPDGIAPCLNKMDGGGREPHIALPCFCDLNYGGSQLTETARCLQARYQKGICNHHGANSGVAVPIGGVYTSVSGEYQRGIKEGLSRALKSEKHDAGVALNVGEIVSLGKLGKHQTDFVQCQSRNSRSLKATDHKNPQKVAIPVLTPERVNKRQNGRRMKEDGEPMFTLTGQDRHGVMVQVSENLCVYAVWYEKYQCYIAIRKLTPKECFRLQGWTDDYFERAAFVSSDSQLYKQAGNGVTVPVIQEIGERMK